MASPFACAIVSLVIRHWSIRSFSDDAVIELRTREAFSGPLLVGQVSRLNTRALGPLWNYLASVVYWMFGGRSVGMFVAAAVLNGLCSVLAVVVMWRRKGPVVGAVFAGAILLMTVALGPHVYADHWNPDAVVFVLPLIFALAWSVADGNDSDLPWLALAASYSAQVHLSGIVSSIVPLFALVVSRRFAVPRRRFETRQLRKALIVAAVCWFPPVVDMVLHPPGNMARVAKFLALSNDHPTPISDGFRVASRALAILPSWIVGAPRVADDPNAWQVASASVVCVTFVVITLAAIRSRSRVTAFPSLTALLLTAVIVLATWRTIGELLDYTVLWTVPAALVIWISAGWVASHGWQPLPSRARSDGRTSRIALSASLVAIAAIGCGGSVRAPSDADQTSKIVALANAIVASTDPKRPIVFDLGPRRDVDEALGLSVVVELIKDGRDVAIPGRAKWFDDRGRNARPGDQIISVTLTAGTRSPLPDGARVLYDDGQTREAVLVNELD